MKRILAGAVAALALVGSLSMGTLGSQHVSHADNGDWPTPIINF